MIPKMRLLFLLGFLIGIVSPAGLAQSGPPFIISATVQEDGFALEFAYPTDSLWIIQAAPAMSGPWQDFMGQAVRFQSQVSQEEAPPADDSPPAHVVIPMDHTQRFFRIRSGSVFSPNAAGYVRVQLEELSLISNPFESGGNSLPEVLGEASPIRFGSTVIQFDATQQAFSATQFGAGDWLDATRKLARGKGALLSGADSSSDLVLGGIVDSNKTFPRLYGGWNLVGLPASMSSVPAGEEGDQIVAVEHGESGPRFENYTWTNGSWAPAEPDISLGEGFWYLWNQPAASPPQGGAVLFSNFGDLVDAPQHFLDGCPLGSDWAAQLYAGADAGSLAPVGEPVPFQTGDGAGYFDTGSEAVRYIPQVSPGAQAAIQVRFWDRSQSEIWESASHRGQSGVFTVTTVRPPEFPRPLVGLEGASPSSPVSMVGQVAGSEIVFPGSSTRFSVHIDYAGPHISYQWQRATDGSDWADLPGENAPSLVIHAVHQDHAGLYRVTADSGCAEDTSEPVQLLVLQSPPFSDPTIDVSTGEFRYTFSAEPAYNYAIDVSSDLIDWTLLRILNNPAGPVPIIDPEAPGHPRRFYRATVLAP